MRLAQFIALLAAALIAALASTPYGFGGLPAMLVRATVSILLAYLAALFAARLTFRLIHSARPARTQLHQLSAFAAAVTWLVPTFLLLRLSSPWAVVCAVAGISLAVSATRAAWREGGQAVSLLTALTLQGGILAVAIGKLAIATAVLALAALLVSLRWSIHRPPVDAFRSPLTLAAVLLVTTASLIQIFGLIFLSEPQRSGTGTVPVFAVAGDPSGRWAPTDPGVILRPKVERKPLEAPPTPSARNAHQPNNRTKPLEIPFAGVYWYFHAPWNAPPPTSVTREGEPASFRFRTADRRPIRMRARQNLGRAINLSCCSRLDVVIRNTDPVRGSIELAVELVDSRSGATVDLGSLPILSHPTFTPAGSAEAASERLSFPLSTSGQFDEFRVAFYLRDVRASRGAQVSIERFVLVPRSW